MMGSVDKFKDKFLDLVVSIPNTLKPQFMAWVDLKVSEYKVTGDLQSESSPPSPSLPAWVSELLDAKRSSDSEESKPADDQTVQNGQTDHNGNTDTNGHSDMFVAEDNSSDHWMKDQPDNHSNENHAQITDPQLLLKETLGRVRKRKAEQPTKRPLLEPNNNQSSNKQISPTAAMTACAADRQASPLDRHISPEGHGSLAECSPASPSEASVLRTLLNKGPELHAQMRNLAHSSTKDLLGAAALPGVLNLSQKPSTDLACLTALASMASPVRGLYDPITTAPHPAFGAFIPPEWLDPHRVSQLAQAAMLSKDNLTPSYLSTEKKCSCHLCGKSFENDIMLRNHVACHDRNSSYVCVVCGAKFNERCLLEMHTNEHHAPPKTSSAAGAPLDLSSPSSTSKAALPRPKSPKSLTAADKTPQLVTMNGHTMYVCQLCKKGYNNKSNFKRHMRILHEHYMTHFCPHCGKGFYRSDHFKMHANSCKGIKKSHMSSVAWQHKTDSPAVSTWSSKSAKPKPDNPVNWQPKTDSVVKPEVNQPAGIAWPQTTPEVELKPETTTEKSWQRSSPEVVTPQVDAVPE